MSDSHQSLEKLLKAVNRCSVGLPLTISQAPWVSTNQLAVQVPYSYIFSPRQITAPATVRGTLNIKGCHPPVLLYHTTPSTDSVSHSAKHSSVSPVVAFVAHRPPSHVSHTDPRDPSQPSDPHLPRARPILLVRSSYWPFPLYISPSSSASFIPFSFPTHLPHTTTIIPLALSHPHTTPLPAMAFVTPVAAVFGATKSSVCNVRLAPRSVSLALIPPIAFSPISSHPHHFPPPPSSSPMSFIPSFSPFFVFCAKPSRSYQYVMKYNRVVRPSRNSPV